MFSVIIFSLVAFFACTTPPLNADSIMGVANLSEATYKKLTICGPATLKNITAKTLNIKGPLKFNNLTVHETTELYGPMENTKGTGTFGSIIVKGPVEAQNIECKETLKITGPNHTITCKNCRQNNYYRHTQSF